MAPIVPYLATAIIILTFVAVIKTVHFYRHIRNKKLKYWFYFNRMAIINSSNPLSEKAKKSQNKFTIFLTMFSIITLVLLMLELKS